MKKTLTAFVAAATMASAIAAMPTVADARCDGCAIGAGVVGGLVAGAIIGGLALGIIETFGAAYISVPYKDAFAFLALVLFLMFRPQGIFGERVAEKA